MLQTVSRFPRHALDSLLKRSGLGDLFTKWSPSERRETKLILRLSTKDGYVDRESLQTRTLLKKIGLTQPEALRNKVAEHIGVFGQNVAPFGTVSWAQLTDGEGHPVAEALRLINNTGLLEVTVFPDRLGQGLAVSVGTDSVDLKAKLANPLFFGRLMQEATCVGATSDSLRALLLHSAIEERSTESARRGSYTFHRTR